MTYIPNTDIIRDAYEYRAEFDAWHERQKRRRPKRGVIETVEQLDGWIMTVCPECAQGKCRNCTGWVLDDDDQEQPCPCEHAA